eukprot:1473218-Amphidinium_carterae.1
MAALLPRVDKDAISREGSLHPQSQSLCLEACLPTPEKSACNHMEQGSTREQVAQQCCRTAKLVLEE